MVWHILFPFPAPPGMIGMDRFVCVDLRGATVPGELYLGGVESGTEHMSEGLWLQALREKKKKKKTSGIWPGGSVRSPPGRPCCPHYTPLMMGSSLTLNSWKLLVLCWAQTISPSSSSTLGQSSGPLNLLTSRLNSPRSSTVSPARAKGSNGKRQELRCLPQSK